MKNVTQKGVYYNLYDSPFYYEIENFKLYFSSEYRKKLFLDKKYLYVKEKEMINYKCNFKIIFSFIHFPYPPYNHLLSF